MQQSALHRPPAMRDVALEQIRTAGTALRGLSIAAFAVAGVAVALAVMEVLTDGEVIDFYPHQWILPGLLGFLFPAVVWHGEQRLGAAFLWTLPVERRRHALTKVFAGWVWLMALVTCFILVLLALSLISGGNVIAEQTLRFLPPQLNPALVGRIDPAAVQTVRWTPNPLLWLVPFTAATATYLVTSAAVLGATLRGIVVAAVGFIVMIIVIGTLGDVTNTEWLIFAPSRLAEVVFYEPYGLATLLTATSEFTPIDTRLISGERVMIARGVPDVARWATATLLWTSAGLAALWLAASRHRERRPRREHSGAQRGADRASARSE